MNKKQFFLLGAAALVGYVLVRYVVMPTKGASTPASSAPADDGIDMTGFKTDRVVDFTSLGDTSPVWIGSNKASGGIVDAASSLIPFLGGL